MTINAFTTQSPEETLLLGADFAKGLSSGDHISLIGELGSGKTCFAKGVISSLTGVPKEEIPSPTFTLVEEYSAKTRIYHVDLYRLNNREAENDIPWDDLLSSETITLVEWPERFPPCIKRSSYEIKFLTADLPNSRDIQIIKKDVA